MYRSIRIAALILALAGIALPAISQVALDNAAVIKMVKGGLGEDLIISMIKNNPGTFDTAPDDLVALKTAGLSDHEISAMTAKSPAVTLNDYDGLEIGVYYKSRAVTQWTNVPSERVYAKSGGAFKSLATHNIIKEDMNGRLDGPASELALNTPLEFLVVTPEGIDGTDFTLVSLNQKKDAREFRTKTGGVFHSSEDVNRNAVSFTQKKLARHTFLLTLPPNTAKGEYAFLAAGLTGSSASGSRGKAYTFHVTE